LKSFAQKESSLRWNSPSVQVLFQLLRIALGKEKPTSLPNDVNWQDVYDLSIRQSVCAIACDGMLAMENCEIDDELRYKWIGQSMVIERKGIHQWETICSLADLYAQHGIKINVLKGFSYASYYPQPYHRQSSDIDICLMDDFEKGNLIVEREIGDVVDRSESKHSHFFFNGIHIENHQFCIGIKGSRYNKELEKKFRNLLNETGVRMDGSNMIRPIWLFNALFFMVHARNHFLVEEGITMKNLCDWLMLREGMEVTTNMEDFWIVCDQVGLLKFAKVIDEVVDYMKDGGSLSEYGQWMLQDILSRKSAKHSINKTIAHLNMIRMIWANRWKYQYYSDSTAIKVIARYVYGYLFDRNPMLN